jgi:hypothetical protein
MSLGLFTHQGLEVGGREKYCSLTGTNARVPGPAAAKKMKNNNRTLLIRARAGTCRFQEDEK